MRNNPIIPTLFIIGVSLSACSSMPEQHTVLEEARSYYSAALSDPDVTNHAALELQQAGEALESAEDAWSEEEDAEVVDHLAYLAKQRALIAQDTGKLRAAEIDIASASSSRSAVRLEARTAEADAARRQAEISDAAAAQSAERVSEMEKELAELNAKKTERGLVITLGDVLFDVNKAELKSGSERNVRRIADFLQEYPERKVLIEGFTDSTGSESYNQVLSERRAEAVRQFLIANGVSADRVTARGYGEMSPVASNKTAAGRQLNRRVEIIISEDGNDVAPR